MTTTAIWRLTRTGLRQLIPMDSTCHAEGLPYMMTPDNVAAFTGTTGQEIRKLLNRGEIQGCRIGVRWLVPKLGLLNYLYKDRQLEEGDSYATSIEMR